MNSFTITNFSTEQKYFSIPLKLQQNKQPFQPLANKCRYK
jgi:hypothetical protein